jgi:hypothetical protein
VSWARARQGPLLALGVAAAYVGGLAVIDPFRPHAIGCPLHRLTGAWCPGCGSSRAIVSLLRGDVTASFRYHPLLLPMLALLGWMWASSLYANRTERPRWVRAPAEIPVALVAAFGLALFGLFVVRNTVGWWVPPST